VAGLLEGLRAIHSTGEAVPETSYYGQLEGLIDEVGKTLVPAVNCVLTTKNRGAGVPGRRPVHRPASGSLAPLRSSAT